MRCRECKKTRLLYAQKKFQQLEGNSSKRLLGRGEYICGAVLSGGDDNRDTTVISKVFAKENLSCSNNIDLPYYSCDGLKPICTYCGKGEKNLITPNGGVSERPKV